jgi:uncharacterized protein YfiM (DUF2279 family)
MEQTFAKSWALVVSLTCTTKSLLIAGFMFLNSFTSSAQDTLATSSIKDSIGVAAINQIKENRERITDPNKFSLTPKQIKSRVRTVAIVNVAGYSTAMIGLYAAWYKNYPQGKFRSFNDSKEWKGVDKIGHAYSAYAESKASMEFWRWTGIGRKKRILLGGLSGAAYQTVIETLDGFSAQWGWSWSDFGANCIGSGLIVGQELAWDEQRIQFKFSFNRKKYKDNSLNIRSSEVFGSSEPSRFLKDYNGQTYWLSANIKSFFPQSKVPSWLMLSLGTGVEGVFGAEQNIGFDKNGVMNFNRPDRKRYRQWYLAPDIDLSKIKTKKKGIRVALDILNIFKFPTPSLEYGNGKMRVNWFHF